MTGCGDRVAVITGGVGGTSNDVAVVVVTGVGGLIVASIRIIGGDIWRKDK